MNIDKKTCINIGIVAFLLYLAIHYWDGLVGLFNLFLAAAGTLINGAIIAYVLNILMRFYERHMAPNTKKKVWNAMRRPVCIGEQRIHFLLCECMLAEFGLEGQLL